jgi:hypothetical protein
MRGELYVHPYRQTPPRPRCEVVVRRLPVAVVNFPARRKIDGAPRNQPVPRVSSDRAVAGGAI